MPEYKANRAANAPKDTTWWASIASEQNKQGKKMRRRSAFMLMFWAYVIYFCGIARIYDWHVWHLNVHTDPLYSGYRPLWHRASVWADVHARWSRPYLCEPRTSDPFRALLRHVNALFGMPINCYRALVNMFTHISGCRVDLPLVRISGRLMDLRGRQVRGGTGAASFKMQGQKGHGRPT